MNEYGLHDTPMSKIAIEANVAAEVVSDGKYYNGNVITINTTFILK